MGWFVRERRGVSWKEQTLESLAAPPLPLVAFLGLFFMVLYFATYSKFQEKVERSKMGLRFGMLLLPVVGIAAVNVIVLLRRWWRFASGAPTYQAAAAAEGGSPWGLLVVVALLLVMVHYHSSFQSWFRSF